MTNRRKCTRRFFFLLVLCVPGWLQAADGIQEPSRQAEPPWLPSEVRAALEKLTSAIAVARVDWTETQAGSNRAKNLASPENFAVWVDRDRFRMLLTYSQAKGYGPGLRGGPETWEGAFDGSVFFGGEPERGTRTMPALLIKHDPFDETDPERFEKRIFLGYLELAGFRAPECFADLAARPLFFSLVLYYGGLSDSTKVEQRDGHLAVTFRVPDPILLRARQVDLARERRELKKLRNSPEYAVERIRQLEAMRALPPLRIVSLRLDPKRGYAIVDREDSTPAGQTILRARSDQWKYYEKPALWLPGRVVEDFYTGRWELGSFSDGPQLTVTYELERAEFGDQQRINFNLQAEYKKPATHVSDFTGPAARANPEHRVEYTVAADGTFTKRSAQQILAEIHDWRAIAKGAGIVFALLALPPIGYLVVRRWRLKRSQE